MTESKIALNDQLALCQQVARLTRAKLPIAGELARAVEGHRSGVAEAGRIVDDKVQSGQSLVHALAGDESIDSRVLAACIEAGELSQSLDTLLEQWAGMHLANSRAAKALANALIYPTTLIVITLLSLAMVIWTMIPQYSATYALFNMDVPYWLAQLSKARDYFGVTMLVICFLCIAPLVIWIVRRRGVSRDGLPAEPATRMRLQALAVELAAVSLKAHIPLKKIVDLAVRAAGGSTEDREQAFSRLQTQQPIRPLTGETSMLLSSVHTGLLSAEDASRDLFSMANHLRQSADWISTRHARWIPMLVAMAVGLATVLTYVFLIYLPWIWLMVHIVETD